MKTEPNQREVLDNFFEYLDSLTEREFEVDSLTQHGVNWIKSLNQ